MSHVEPGAAEPLVGARPASTPAVPAHSARAVVTPTGDRQPAFFTLDHGTATLAGALVGRVDRRWRLLAATALPAGSSPDALVDLLVDRVRAADPACAEAIWIGPGSGPEPPAAWPRLAASSAPVATLAVIAAT